jgi:hypothetical protein
MATASSCDGLTFSSSIQYTVAGGLRTCHGARPPVGTRYARILEARLPLVLCPATWARYALSPADIQSTFASVPSSLTWQMHLLLSPGADPGFPLGGITGSLDNPYEVTFSRKPNMVRRMIALHTHHTSTASVLCSRNKQHCPLLPMIGVSAAVFDACVARVPEREPSYRWCVTYDTSLKRAGVEYVPVYRHKASGMVCLYRVVTDSEYRSIRPPPRQAYATIPSFVVIRGTSHVLTEEACLVHIAPDSSSRPADMQLIPIATGD